MVASTTAEGTGIRQKKGKKIDEVVEEIGFGAAQWHSLILAGGIWFCDGCEMALISIMRKSIGNDLDLPHDQQALLTTSAALGVLIGAIVAGQFGDQLGRRLPIVTSYFLVTIFGLASACGETCAALAICRVLLGFGIGIGMPPAVAMLSENCPKEHRIFSRTVQGVTMGLGSVAVLVLCCADDATLKHLKWRAILVAVAGPPLVIGICAFFFLRESAVYLVTTGQTERAVEVLTWMKNTNKVEVDVSNVQPMDDTYQATFSEQFEIVTSKKYFYPLLIAAHAAFVLNVQTGGLTYASSEVIEDDGSARKGTKMLALTILCLPYALAIVRIGKEYTRRECMMIAMWCGFLGGVGFAATGRLDDTPHVIGIAYYASCMLMAFEQCLGYIVINQFAVELLPTIASSTGGAIVIGAGKLGALLAPGCFEIVHHMTDANEWNIYFYIAAVGCFVSTAQLYYLKMEGEKAPFELSDISETTALKKGIP